MRNAVSEITHEHLMDWEHLDRGEEWFGALEVMAGETIHMRQMGEKRLKSMNEELGSHREHERILKCL